MPSVKVLPIEEAEKLLRLALQCPDDVCARCKQRKELAIVEYREAVLADAELPTLRDTQRVIEVFPPTSGKDYLVQDLRDAIDKARGLESAAKSIKDDLRLQGTSGIRDALRHSMQLGQGLHELQHYLMGR